MRYASLRSCALRSALARTFLHKSAASSSNLAGSHSGSISSVARSMAFSFSCLPFSCP